MLGILPDLQGTCIPPLTIVTPLRLAQAKKPEYFFPVPVVSGTGTPARACAAQPWQLLCPHGQSRKTLAPSDPF